MYIQRCVKGTRADDDAVEILENVGITDSDKEKVGYPPIGVKEGMRSLPDPYTEPSPETI